MKGERETFLTTDHRRTDHRKTAMAEAAHVISEGFEAWHAAFCEVSARAAGHFARQAWREGEEDDGRRLALYEQHVQETLRRLRAHPEADLEERAWWTRTREAFGRLRTGRPNPELAETFYNSLTRRIFETVGVDARIEFVSHGLTVPETMAAAPRFEKHPKEGETAAFIAALLRRYDLGVPYLDLARDAGRVAERIDAAVAGLGPIERLEMLTPVFYRNKGAYLVGRVVAGGAVLPLVLPVLHAPGGGLRVDTVLLTPNEVSQVFSFTRSYFHVACEQPWAIVRFLKTLMPLKRIAELYIALGFTKHGKTELYRDLCAHLDGSDDRFVAARGTEGMVMAVFTLPGFDIVFKVIKDRFEPPKQVTREEVRRKYRFVMLHDRVGRLADVQEFEHLEFPRARFEPALLAHLLEVAGRTVHVEGEHVVLEHLYTERRVVPLNLFLQEVEAPEAEAAVLDCGQAVKDLAAADIFPGDMLVKNFGVTRHGRVIFYDYDELGHLGAYTFRKKPEPRDEIEMMSAEAWFYVGPNDIFPEEIGTFIGLPARYLEVFLAQHGDLLEPAFWQRMQALQKEPEPVDLFPYPPEKRFPLDGGIT